MRYRTEDGRLRRLEAALSEGTITTTDEAGDPVRLTGSGLQLGFALLDLADEAGKTAFDLRGDDLPDDLRREAGLWSRAEVREDHGTAAIAVQELCRAITGGS
ncbi:MAG: hypothetical protein QM433_08130 [Euryarchaeota archaeon]|jgi:hypothetical protein|nr:hypothetical protein [Euryarchaeota archaeon]